MTTKEKRARTWICLFFIGIVLLGWFTVGDYGRYWDELSEIRIFRMAIMEYGELLPFETDFHQSLKAMGVIPLSQSVEMDHNFSLYYPIAFLACNPSLNVNQFAVVWRCYTWAVFVLGLFSLYAVSRRMGLSRSLSCATVVLLLFSPRFFAQGHYNNKDIALMSLTGLCLWQSLRLAEKPCLSRAALFGLAAGLCVNTRIIGGAICGLCGGMILLRLWREGRLKGPALRAVGAALGAAVAFYALLTPAMLKSPGEYLSYVLKNSYNFSRWNGTMLFMGQQIDLSSQKPPFYYLPVMIFLTTPLTQLALVGAGSVRLVGAAVRRRLEPLKKESSFAAMLCLLMWVLPLLGCMLLRVRVYNGWRHVYFLYIPMMATAAWGLEGLARRLRGKRTPRAVAVWGLTAVLLIQGGLLAKNHPFQYAYYNPLVSRQTLETRYDLDYWNVSVYQALMELRSRPEVEKPLRIRCTDPRTRSGYAFATTWMTPEVEADFLLVEDAGSCPEDCYLLANTSYRVLAGYELPKIATPTVALQSYGATICAIYPPVSKEVTEP